MILRFRYVNLSSDNQHYEKIGKDVKCIEDEIPFEIPESWEWCRLGSIAYQITDGEHKTPRRVSSYCGYYLLSARNIINGNIKLDNVDYVDSEEYANISRRCNPQKGDVLISCSGSVGRVCVVEDNNQYVMVRSAAMIRPVDCNPFYLMHMLQSGLLQVQIKKASRQTAQANLFQGAIKNLLIPVAPLSEQIRIKNEMLLYSNPLAKYEIYQSATEQLNGELKPLLKKSILQYAIQGKLVPQDPNDEPASVLLDRIRAEKEQLIKDGKIKRDKNESYIYRGSDNSYYISFHGVDECIDDEIPFEIPDNWCWVTLSSICTYIQRGKSPKYSDIEKIPVIAQKCNQWSGFDISKAKFIEPESIEKYEPERYLCTGDLLWNSTGLGTVGRMAIYDESKNKYGIAVADSHVSVIRTKDNFANYRYLFYWFTSPAVQSVIESKTEGSTKQKELYLQRIKNYVIPLPPLKEQNRIVNEIDKYMSFDF